MITDALITYMINSSSISIDRIYPLRARQNTEKPLAIVYLDGIDRMETFSGANATREGDFQIDVYGQTVASTQTVAKEITTALETFEGAMGDYYIFNITIDTESNGFEDATELYFHSIFLTVTYK